MKTKIPAAILLFLPIYLVNGQNTFTWNVEETVTTSQDSFDSIKFTGLGEHRDTIIIIEESSSKHFIVNDTIISLTTILVHVDQQNNATLFNARTEQSLTIVRSQREPTTRGAQNSKFMKSIETIAPILDALNIKKNLTDTATVAKILSKYGQIANNPFLDSLPKERTADLESLKENVAATTSQGLDITKYADGIARFLVKRTKEELSISFFTKFKDVINSPSYKDLQTLFPTTKQGLNLIGDEIYNYQQYITILREGFENDLKLLPDHVPDIIDNHDTFFKEHPNLKVLIQVSSFIAAELRDNSHPGAIIANFNGEELSDLHPVLEHSFETLKLISECLRGQDNNENKYWVDLKDIKEVAADSQTLKIFLGLMLEVYKSKALPITFDNQSLDSILIDIHPVFDSRYASFKSMFIDIGENVHKLNNIIKAKGEKQDTNRLNIDDVLLYFNSAADLIQNLSFIDTLIGIQLPDSTMHSRIDQLTSAIKTSSNLIANVNYRKYGAAIVNLVSLYEIALPKSDPNHTRQRDYILKYGNFMASLVQAETSEDVADIIDAFALPPGSSRIKRESATSVSLNSFVGPFWGSGESGQYYGLSAPVGVAFSLGGIHWMGNKRPGKSEGGKSFSLIFTVLDVGALTAFRFQNDTLDVPSIYLKEIISPGIFLSYGMGKSPISINAGYQRVPLLQKVGEEANDVLLNKVGRWNASLVVDIPVLNLHSTPKIKNK